MADITMCMIESNQCDKAFNCRRHKASGTRASDLQSMAYFKPDENGDCKDYWPVKEVSYDE